ncbi:MAG: hemolysin family protein [Desulfonatronovibrionaceae bacterium]
MEDSSDSRFWSFLRRIFGQKCDLPLEEIILEAKDEGELKADEVAMLLNVLQLGQKQASEIMIPRTDLVCAEAGNSLREVVQVIIESGHSRIPIYRENRDHIVGIIHAKDLLSHLLEGEAAKAGVEDIMRPPFFVPDTKNIKQILVDFQNNKIHMAIVLDEYGGTSGILTLEDVLEEIVGEIEDEYDPPKQDEIEIQEDGTVVAFGRTSLEELAERAGIELDSEQVETVGGYVCGLVGRVPEVDEEVRDGCYLFKVQEADAKQIKSLLIRTLPSQELP